MKYIASLFLALGMVALGSQAEAQTLPSGLPGTADFSYSVVNISQGNQDATTNPARPGDTLRYEVAISSDTEDVEGFVAQIDVSEILKSADMIDSGLGTVSGGVLSYPEYTHKAPCGKKFTFFVRVKKDCGDMNIIDSSANEVAMTQVALQCEALPETPTQEPTKLVTSGPNAGTIIGFILFLTMLLGVQLATRRD